MKELHAQLKLLFQHSPLGVEGSLVEKESPLDHLPCYPASLPFAKDLTEEQIEQVPGNGVYSGESRLIGK